MSGQPRQPYQRQEQAQNIFDDEYAVSSPDTSTSQSPSIAGSPALATSTSSDSPALSYTGSPEDDQQPLTEHSSRLARGVEMERAEAEKTLSTKLAEAKVKIEASGAFLRVMELLRGPSLNMKVNELKTQVHSPRSKEVLDKIEALVMEQYQRRAVVGDQALLELIANKIIN